MLQHSLKPDLPLVMVPSRQEWRAWLSENYASSQGVWVVTYKKSSSGAGAAYVSARDINEECLCFGWIDSKPGKIDEQRTALLCTPTSAGRPAAMSPPTNREVRGARGCATRACAVARA